MVYLIHLETTRTTVRHCIAILENSAEETLSIYDIQPASRLMANLLALDLEWTCIRLWQTDPWYKNWPWQKSKSGHVCPVCGVRC